MSKNIFASPLLIAPPTSSPRLRFPARRIAVLAICALFLSAAPAFAAPSKEIIELQQQIKDLQDAVAHLQQSNDERMGVMKDLVQQSADAVNRMSVNLDTMQKRILGQQEAQGTKVDQVSGQIQSLNDSLDELKARMSRLEKLTQDIQNQQQSLSANVQNIQQSGGALPGATPPPTSSQFQQPLAPLPGPTGKKGKPSAAVPANNVLPPTPPTEEAAAPPPADELYKTALGDYMTAKYALAASEFGDVVKFYPENPLAGNSYYYQAEIEYRGGKYPAAIKHYDQVLEQFPDSSKVPVAHLHKGQALIALKQNDAGVRELRLLIQRFPASPEAMSARSKLSGMGIPVTPRTTTGRPTAPPE
jgi:TolA-binding protein